ncbi:hypothetical protein M8C21_008891 [Ambrosia artemisiifolia]|uniref:Uncharacterized protein n=1 Tax=Ambrosia artemisiifolia TaxID=4212 RepID=A0AAD5GHX2_AMBAR|nr:hypothetical protein M8C21_008891 [Ambrosia artemisiifolia]
MNTDDNWLQSAFDDVTLVAQVILNLRHSSPSSLPKTWTTRQRRSRPPPPATVKKPSSTRDSPTTPLSLSGGAATTSVSGGCGVEETSRLILDGSDALRSKVIRANETTPTKRPRRKKTLAELKEDEIALLKERKQLKRQLASLQATCQKQRKENESLKKMKNEMKSQQVLVVSNCTEEQKNDSFVIPDLNIPAGEEC